MFRPFYAEAFPYLRKAYRIIDRCDNIQHVLRDNPQPLCAKDLKASMNQKFSQSTLNALVRAGYVKKEIRKEEFIETTFWTTDLEEYFTIDLNEDGTYTVTYRPWYTGESTVYKVYDMQVKRMDFLRSQVAITGKIKVQVKRAYYSWNTEKVGV